MTPEEKFLHYIQMRRDVINQSSEQAPDWMKACDKSVLFYLDRIEEDFNRAFGRESE